jgi:tetratricopeptide (TPR) repeat protein
VLLLRDYPAESGVVLAYERVCRQLGTLPDALGAIAGAIRHDSTNALLWQAELRVLGDLGRTDELVSEGERWLRAMPGQETVYREYAMALRRVGDFDGAARVLLEGRERTARPAMLTIALADIYVDEARWGEAAELWLDVLEASPDMGWDLVVSRFESLKVDQGAAAAEVLLLVGDVPSSIGAARLGTIAALYSMQPELAQGMAEAALSEMSRDLRRDFIEDFAAAAVRRGQPALVAWAYRNLLRDMPGDSTALDIARQIVQHDLSAGDTAIALSTLDDLLSRARPGTAAHQWAAASRLRLVAAAGEANDAGDGLEIYAELYPNDRNLPYLALVVAEAFLRDGRPDESRDVLELVTASGTDREVMAQMSALRAYLALYAGEFDEARANFELAAVTLTGSARGDAIRLLRLLRSASEDELRAVSAAHLAVIQHEPKLAFERLMNGLDATRPSAARPSLLVWAGELALAAGEPRRAEQVLRSVPALYPESGEAPLALMTLAEALADAERRDEAIAVLETLIIDYPESALTPIGRRRLAELREQIPRS